eukprot:498646-Pelagomonas_calceolata.AAC.6
MDNNALLCGQGCAHDLSLQGCMAKPHEANRQRNRRIICGMHSVHAAAHLGIPGEKHSRYRMAALGGAEALPNGCGGTPTVDLWSYGDTCPPT